MNRLLMILGLIPVIHANAAEPRLPIPQRFGDSHVRHLNGQGDAIGLWEVFDTQKRLAAEIPFLTSGDEFFVLPQFPPYAAFEPQAISDHGIIVGHVRSPTVVRLPVFRPVTYDVQTRFIRPLPQLPETSTGIACDISTDGHTISGQCAGTPCVWRKMESRWQVQTLAFQFKDKVGQTDRVMLSPNGRLAVASLTLGRNDLRVVVWTHADGQWTSEVRSRERCSVFEINDDQTIVGSVPIVRNGQAVTEAVLIERNGTVRKLGCLDDDLSSTAQGINNAGVIVGWSDTPGRKDQGPRGFTWHDGTMKPLSLTAESHQALAINERGDIGGMLVIEGLNHAAAFVLPALSREEN